MIIAAGSKQQHDEKNAGWLEGCFLHAAGFNDKVKTGKSSILKLRTIVHQFMLNEFLNHYKAISLFIIIVAVYEKIYSRISLLLLYGHCFCAMAHPVKRKNRSLPRCNAIRQF